MTSPTSSRDSSIDALRGLAITLVVIGHAIPDAAAVFHDGPGLINLGGFWVPMATASGLFLSFVYSFHMPLFAFVSGLVMWPPRGKSLGVGIVNRVRSLLVPYVAWFVILYFGDRWAPSASKGFGPALFDAAIGRSGLWYLYALFICSVVVIVLERVPGSRWVLPASALIAIACSVLEVPNVANLSAVLWIYPFVVLGYLMGPAKSWVLEHRLLTIGAGAIAFLPLFYLRQPFHVPNLQPISHLAALIEGLAVTMHNAGVRGGYVISLLLQPVARLPLYLCAGAAIVALYALYIGQAGRAIDVQAWFGRKSLGIYAIHGPVLWWLVSMGVRDVVVLSLVSLTVASLLTALLERVPLVGPVLLGQRIERHRESSPATTR
jgi:fucose 4-O-acetylase-like acetyltransferase